MNVTIRDYLERTRESMLYLRERMEDYRMAELKARNPLKRDLDGMVLELAEQKKELDTLAVETEEKGKHAYALIGLLADKNQKEAMWAYFAYGLTEAAAMKRGRYKSRHEMQTAMVQGLRELEKLVYEFHKKRKGTREGRECLN